VHRLSLLLPEGGETTELTNPINLLAPILARHGAVIGEIHRLPAQTDHAAFVGDAIRENLPTLVRVEGSDAWNAVLGATRALDATLPESRGAENLRWLVITSDQPRAEEMLVDHLRTAFDASVVTPAYASLPARTVSELSRRGLVLSAAESCTGGMFGEQITSIAGSSSMFWGSLVTYSYEAKSAVLGVNPDTLDQRGAVSEEVVREMAAGVRRIGGSDIAVAISGIAGPGGGTEEKPVGTVWIACETSWGGSRTRLLELEGGRNGVRQKAVWDCLRMVLSCLDSRAGDEHS